MNAQRFVATVLSAVVLALLTGCDWVPNGGDGGGGVERFVVPVDSVQVPASIAVSEALPVTLVGTIGHNGCHRLHEIRAERSEGETRLTVIGEVDTGPQLCTAAFVYLRETYVVQPPFSQAHTVVVRQPDGEDTRRTVDIQP